MSTYPGTCIKCNTRFRWSDSKADYICNCTVNTKSTLNTKKIEKESMEEFYYVETGVTVNNEIMYKRVRRSM